MTDQDATSSQRIGVYRLTRRLGRGGMGEVWLAHDTALKRDVAVKLLPGEISSNERAVKRFLREARSAAKLNHPNVMTVHQIGKHRGRIFIVMELVEGGSLADELKKAGPLGWREATEVVRDAARGLAAAHARGLVHRDIKPSNLMRTGEGVVKVVDFGLARAQKETLEVTRPGGVIGTPAFIAPEQGRGRNVDARSDLYSLACTYYALLTGRVPFPGDTSSAVIYQHVHEPFPDALQIVDDLPDAIGRILDRGTRKDPIDRYQSAEEMIADLEAALSGASLGTTRIRRKPARPGDATGERARRNRVIAGSLVGLGTLATLAVVLLVVYWPKPRPPLPKPQPIPDWTLTPEQARRKQREAEAVWSAPAQTALDLGGGVTVKLALVPPGLFAMGSDKTTLGWYADQGPRHEVAITRPFYLGVTEVTQAQWKALMGTEPWKQKPHVREGDDYPAAFVSWHDCVAFCKAASAKTARTIRLPTEAEWEYACRAGSGGQFSFGDAVGDLKDHAWYGADTQADDERYAHAVGQKKPNAWGLYDVHGNLWEWCSDWFGEDYYAHSDKADPHGPPAGKARILRGGCLHDPPGACRSAFRLGTDPSYEQANVGFRIVCEVKPTN